MLLFLRVAVAASFFSLRTHRSLALENLALRHQLAVLQRAAPPRPRLTRLDRALWSWLSRVFDEWRHALLIVRPETVVRWHRAAFRWFWRRKSRGGRPSKEYDVVRLIK